MYLYKVKDFSNALHYHCNWYFYQKLPVHNSFNQTIKFYVALQIDAGSDGEQYTNNGLKERFVHTVNSSISYAFVTFKDRGL